MGLGCLMCQMNKAPEGEVAKVLAEGEEAMMEIFEADLTMSSW